MSSEGGPPPKSLDASGLPVPDAGGSTSIPFGCHPFKVSLMASSERNMRDSSNDGGGGAGSVGGACDDALLPRIP
jgi:hypothetical protein